jgi:hypothetical protein
MKLKIEDLSPEAFAYYDEIFLALNACKPANVEEKIYVWRYLVQMLCSWITEEQRGLDVL